MCHYHRTRRERLNGSYVEGMWRVYFPVPHANGNHTTKPREWMQKVKTRTCSVTVMPVLRSLAGLEGTPAKWFMENSFWWITGLKKREEKSWNWRWAQRAKALNDLSDGYLWIPSNKHQHLFFPAKSIECQIHFGLYSWLSLLAQHLRNTSQMVMQII